MTKREHCFLTKLAILIAIEIIIAVTPLGSLPAIGLIVMTLAHIPVIIGAIVLGIKGGLIMGFCVWSSQFSCVDIYAAFTDSIFIYSILFAWRNQW